MKLCCTHKGLILYSILKLRAILTAVTTTIIIVIIVIIIINGKGGSEREGDLLAVT